MRDLHDPRYNYTMIAKKNSISVNEVINYFDSFVCIPKIELGVNMLTQSKILKIANALCTTPGYIMGWDSEPSFSFPLPPSSAPEKYSLLDDADRQKVDGYIDALLSDPKYQKKNIAELEIS